jgi:hypothetical protein
MLCGQVAVYFVGRCNCAVCTVFIVVAVLCMWLYYVYCGYLMCIVVILCVLWLYYLYCGYIMCIVVILCVLWLSYVYCGYIMCIVVMLCVLWLSYVLRSIPKEAFADSFQKLYERCQPCSCEGWRLF